MECHRHLVSLYPETVHMKRKEHKRLKTIGWLMLACLLLLIVFSCSWLAAQYREEEKRLHSDIAIVFDKTRDSILNKALDKEISIILNDSLTTGTKLKFQLKVAKTQISSNDFPKDIKAMDPGAIRNVTIIKNGTDSGDVFMEKALRGVMTRTMQSQDHLYRQFVAAIDTVQLENAFQKAIQKKNTRFRTIKVSGPEKDSIFVYAAPPMSTSYLKIEGYKPYLLKQILPQLGFSIFLLLLSALTFLLAYRNMWRQQRFGQQKDNFISNISHELKTPVATTKVALEALSNYNALEDPKRSKQYLHIANSEMDRLEQLVNRVLNTIQTEHGVLQLEREPVDLIALLRDITDALSPAMQEQGINFSFITTVESVMLSADKMHLRGAIYNLLDNAIKYGGNLLTTAVSVSANNVLVSIWDNGGGIPAVYHESVFEKFFRVPQGNKHDVKGHGLGLSYARYVLEAHKGTVRLSSRSEQGTTFIVSLPLTERDEV